MTAILCSSINQSLVGSFENYKLYAKSILDLTEEVEINLVKKLNYSNNEAESMNSAKQLVLSQLKNVIRIAEQHSGYGIPTEDLVQEGNVGLMKAVRGYKLGLNTRLYSYAIIWIKSEIQSYILKNWKIVKAATTNSLRKLFFNFRSIQNKLLNAEIPPSEFIGHIAKILNVSEEDVREMKDYLTGSDMSISLNNEEDDLLLYDFKTPDHLYEEVHDGSKISQILRKNINLLSQQQKEVIELKYLGNSSMTNKEISKVVGLSSERVRQIEAESLEKLKLLMLN